MDKNYNVITFISKCIFLGKPRVANFFDMIKIATMFIRKTFRDSKIVERIRNYVLKCNLYLYFLILQKLLIFGEKILMSAELRGVSRVLYAFWIFFK